MHAETVPHVPRPIPLVEVTRGPLVESVHLGSFVATGADGTVILSGGDPGRPIYPRSALKPLQLIAMVRAGLELPDPLLALAAGSHSGAAVHREGVERILELSGLTAAALRNTPELPYGLAEREEWLAEGGTATRVTQTCSGKHAAMLASCVLNAWMLDDYLDPGHPLQRLIEATVAEFTGEAASAVSIDGCGTPVFAYSLPAIARAYGRLASADGSTPEGRVAGAIRAHPEMLAGRGRDVVALMHAVPGAVAKDGAEAVQLVGLADGRALAIKIADGSDRARMPLTVALLEALGVEGDGLAGLRTSPVLGGGRPVGELRAVQVR